MLFSFSDALSGFGTSIALIAAIGAQNALVLRQGVRREFVGTVVLICLSADVILMLSGVAGMGALVTAAPKLITIVTWVGALFLFAYGFLSLRKGLWGAPESLDEHDADAALAEHGANLTDEELASRAEAAQARKRARHRKIALTVLAVTWLNPHVYLDTLVFLGSAAAAHGQGRWSFGFGAVAASALWFPTIGYGARYLAPLFKKPITWKVLDILVGVLMIFLGFTLLYRH